MSGEIKGRTGVKHEIKRRVERVKTEREVEDGVEIKTTGERGMDLSHTLLTSLRLANKDAPSDIYTC